MANYGNKGNYMEGQALAKFFVVGGSLMPKSEGRKSVAKQHFSSLHQLGRRKIKFLTRFLLHESEDATAFFGRLHHSDEFFGYLETRGSQGLLQGTQKCFFLLQKLFLKGGIKS